MLPRHTQVANADPLVKVENPHLDALGKMDI